MDHEQALRRDYFYSKTSCRHCNLWTLYTFCSLCCNFAVPVWITLIKAIVNLSGGTRGVDQQFQAAALFYVVNELVLNEATGQTKGHLP